jgi:hypothetical protein
MKYLLRADDGSYCLLSPAGMAPNLHSTFQLHFAASKGRPLAMALL